MFADEFYRQTLIFNNFFFFEVTPLMRDTCSLMPFGYVTSFSEGPISQYELPVILLLILACYQGMLNDHLRSR